ncbi:hypothetical protein U9M48_039006 [Paspalum notatum var. saurae]|uniref:NHL domain-containing protein n=1 Tax=Paspalum notatum var. saurae TaxID=547442 RepID=A0AAQ3UPC3_PASNO
MASPPLRAVLLCLPLLLLLPLLAAATLVLEDGYTVTTFADLNPHQGSASPSSPAPGSGPHPYALLPRPHAGDVLLLDSAGSGLYTLSLSSPPCDEPRVLAGAKRAGFDDGGPGHAAFDRPRSVAVDGADNVYVADRLNRAVRKVAPSGYTTTIAGGLSSGPGRRDGPAQNATFSPDFELVYVPKICALLVADRGNRLIRQINLKPEDCAHEARPESLLKCADSCNSYKVGSKIGFCHCNIVCITWFSYRVLSSPFLPHQCEQEVYINHLFSRIQKQCKIAQRKATLISFYDIKSAVASSAAYPLLVKLVRVSRGYLTVLFPSVRLQQKVPCKPSRRLDLRRTSAAPNIGLNNKAPLPPTEQLGDLISFAGNAGAEDDTGKANCQEGKEPSFDCELIGLIYTPHDSIKKIDHMIEANLSGFLAQEECHSLTASSCSVSRRRVHGDK